MANEIINEIQEILDKYDVELIGAEDGSFEIKGYSYATVAAVKYAEEKYGIYGTISFSSADIKDIVKKAFIAGYVKALKK